MSRGLEAVCRDCWREKARAYSQVKRESGFIRVQTIKLRIRHQIDQIKLNAGCADCGYNQHPAALEFDHLPGREKRQTVSWFISRNKLDEALAEINNCEVVCANCHRIRTFDRKQYSGRKPKAVAQDIIDVAVTNYGKRVSRQEPRE